MDMTGLHRKNDDMENKEKIKVFIEFDEHGNTQCICKRSQHRRCGKNCSPEVVERDRYYGWEQTFKQDRYGKSLN